MPIITGTTGDDSILRGVNSAGVVVVTPPSGPNAGEDDLVLALAGNDVVAPGDGDDTAFLGSGDDRFIWDPGEGSDVVRGGQDVDTLEFNGSDAVEIFTISDTQLLRDVGNIQMDLTSIERIELNGLDGDDVIDATALTQDVELIVNGGRGNDIATLGGGDDRFIWNPGDGSDVVDGRDGTDTLEFNGSDDVETFTISDSQGGVQLLRDVGNIQMDLTNIERIELNGLDGDDVIDATALTQDVELVVNGGRGNDTATLGAGDDRFIWNPGDGSDVVDGRDGTDTLEFNGSDDVETFTISDSQGGVQLLRDVGNIQMDLTSIERIELNGLDGDDVIDATALTQDVELIVNGGRGDDTATLGAGDDRFIWNPGDGSDVVDGRDGTDTLEFNGSDADEEFTISDADGGVQLFRDVGNILMDLTNVERIELNGLGGNDLVDAASLTQDVELIIDGGEGDDVLIAGVSSDVVRGGGGSEFMLGGAGSDRFVFGIEASDGTTDLDTIGDYEVGSDVIDLAEAGGLAGSEQVTGGLLLTLAGVDGDQVFLANVNAIDDVMIA